MLIPVKKLITTMLVSMLSLAPLSAVGLTITVDTAFAKNNNGKGNSGKAKDKKPNKARKARNAIQTANGGRGAIASELKDLKAAHSLKNGQGYLNASANSNTGTIATYGVADYTLGEAQTARDAYVDNIYSTDAYACYDSLGAFVCDPASQGNIDAEIATYKEFVASDGYAAALLILDGDVADAQNENDLAFAAIGADRLIDPAVEYFNTLLAFGDFRGFSAGDTEAEAEYSDIAEASFQF